MSKEPLAHVLRSRLPWRKHSDLTECGLNVSSVKEAMTRDEFVAKVTREGERRASFSTCMTRWDTCRKAPEGSDALVLDTIYRFVDRARWGRNGLREEFIADMHAVEVLIERHRAEFDELIEYYQQVVRVAFGKVNGRSA